MKQLILLFLALILSATARAQMQKGNDIVGEGAFDNSGYSVSMPDANTVAIGAYLNDGAGADAGHVRIYEYVNGAWQQKGLDIDGEAADDQSGYSVSMPDANTVAIGAPYNDGTGVDAGHVRIYEYVSGAWQQKGLDIDGEAAGDVSGFSVSMPDVNTVAIGARVNANTAINAGHVRIYEYANGAWQQKGLDIDGEGAGDVSGHSVSMPDANTVAIGAPLNDAAATDAGHVRIYEYVSGAWQQKGTDIDGEAAGDQAGWSVSMPDANTVAIGAPRNDAAGTFSGHVRIYEYVNGAWQQKGVDIDGEAADDRSGFSVSMPDANTVAIGALFNDGTATSAGHVRIYEYVNGAWQQKGADIDGEAGNDWSGRSVSIPDVNTVAIGAPRNDDNASSSGHVRVYSLLAPQIEVVGNGLTITNGQTSISTNDDTDFGDVVAAGTASTTRSFTIRNTGTAPLAINGISSSDAAFTTTPTPSVIAASDSATFDITFDPTTQNTFSSVISINNDDADDGIFTFAVEGTGTAATAVTQLGAGTVIELFPNPVNEALTLRFSAISSQQELDIRILNNLGQIVYEGRRVVNSADVVEIREVSSLPSGSYYLQLNCEGENLALPFVKQ